MDIGSRVKQLLDSYHSILDLLSRLENLSSSSEAVRVELSSTIQLKLKEYATEVDYLELEVNGEPASASKRGHVVSLDMLKENIRLARQKFRRAQIQSQKNVERTWKEERELLFGDRSATPSSQSKPLSDQDRLVSKSESITETLRHIHQMAQAEVVKSALNAEELQYSTKTLRELEQKYSAFDVMLNGSQRLIRHLEEADTRDRRYMLASLSFLGAVVLWILWRRIFKLPVKFLLWVILKFFGAFNFFRPSSTDPDTMSKITESALSAVASSGEASSISNFATHILTEVTATALEITSIVSLTEVLSDLASSVPDVSVDDSYSLKEVERLSSDSTPEVPFDESYSSTEVEHLSSKSVPDVSVDEASSSTEAGRLSSEHTSTSLLHEDL